MLELALEGDATCLKVAADRLWPALNRSELSGIEGEAIQVEAPDWKEWTTEELAEISATAVRIAQKLRCDRSLALRYRGEPGGSSASREARAAARSAVARLQPQFATCREGCAEPAQGLSVDDAGHVAC